MSQPVRFALVGIANTVLGLAVIFAAKGFLGLGDLAANAIGYAAGLVASFALNRNWTFRDRTHVLPAFWRFLGAFAVAYSVNLLAVFTLRDAVGVNAYLAQAAGVVPYTVLFYLASRYYVFRASRRAA